MLLPPMLVASVFLGSLFARMRDRVRVAPVPARSSTLVLLGTWLLFPVVTLFLVSTLTPVDFLSPRYFASVTPAIALFAGWAIASLQPAAVRRLVAFVLAILSVLAFGGTLKNGEDWRGTAAFERAHADPDTVVLLHPALVESAQLDWFSDPEKRSYLLSVQSYYPMDGRVLPMPYVLDDGARDYLEGLVTGELAGADRFLLVTRYPQVPFRDWLDGRLRSEGYTSRRDRDVRRDPGDRVLALDLAGPRDRQRHIADPPHGDLRIAESGDRLSEPRPGQDARSPVAAGTTRGTNAGRRSTRRPRTRRRTASSSASPDGSSAGANG